MPSYRIDKVASLIKEELSLIFLHKIQDPKLSIITVTNIKVSPDLRHTKVYLSVYDKDKRQEVLDKVNELKGWIRTQLAGRIQIRFVPELDFYIDDTLDYVEKIENLIKKIHEDDNKKNIK
ncbi:MAG: 30S ribosome-binding factor RbfA [Melioribacter sp.]|nr:30S ribosome-binding factor RbfA [Melioribacter sp.]